MDQSNRLCTKNDIHMVNKIMKRYPTSYAIRDGSIKTTMKYYYIPIRRVKIPYIDNTKCWQGYGATGTLSHCWRGWQNGAAALEDNWFLTKLNTFLECDPAITLLDVYPNTPWCLCPHKSLCKDVCGSKIRKKSDAAS